MKIVEKKIKQRIKFTIKRNNLYLNNNIASKLLQEHLKDLIFFKKSKIIASFISIKTEISTKFLNDFILSKNKTLCLPVIDERNDRLIFKEYNSKTKLLPGKYGVMEPRYSVKNLIPEIIFTPCLSFDESGFRLGYGGGYYDKTFFYLKKNKQQFISIAVAFDDQKAKQVIHDNYDQKINYILTEKKLYEIQ